MVISASSSPPSPPSQKAWPHLDRRAGVVVAALLGIAGPGCGAGAQDRRWEVKEAAARDPLAEARVLVQRFAGGGQVGSEAEGFPDLIRRVTEADAEKGAKLKKLLETRGGPDAAAASALLKEL